MSKRLRNRIVLVGGFLVCLGIVITAIILIIVAICGGFSGNNSVSRDVAELAGVEVVYDTSAEPVKPVVSRPEETTSSDTESTPDTSSSDVSSDVSSDTASEETPVSSEEPVSSETSSTDTSSADTSSTIADVMESTEKSPEDFVADFVNNAA